MLKCRNRAAMEDHSSSCEFPLLTTPNNDDLAKDGSTNLKRRPSRRSLTRGWATSLLIIGIEIAERISYYGIVSNLVTYLTNVMHQTTATAAKNVNIWAGTPSMLPLLRAFVADSYLGRYWTILVSSIVYLVVSSSVPNSFFWFILLHPSRILSLFHNHILQFIEFHHNTIPCIRIRGADLLHMDMDAW